MAKRIKNVTPLTESGSDESIRHVLDEITKRHGEGSVWRGVDKPMQVEVISTGSLSLDIALGVGGLPRGRIIEVYGAEGAGKSSLCLHVIREAQKSGGRCAFIDMEHALDMGWAAKIGVDLNNVYLVQPDHAEQALDIAEIMIKSGQFPVIVIDSVASLVPRAEIEGSTGDVHVGLQARLMSQALRRLTGLIKTTNCIVMFTNQLREKIGVTFGSPEMTPGGRALKFYASVRLDIRRIQGIKQGDMDIGNRTRVKVKKNKVAPPFKEAEFDIYVDSGISLAGEIVDLGVDAGVLEKRGAFYRYSDELIGQGRQNAINYLNDPANDFTRNEIHGKILEYYRVTPNAIVTSGDDDSLLPSDDDMLPDDN